MWVVVSAVGIDGDDVDGRMQFRESRAAVFEDPGSSSSTPAYIISQPLSTIQQT